METKKAQEGDRRVLLHLDDALSRKKIRFEKSFRRIKLKNIEKGAKPAQSKPFVQNSQKGLYFT